MKYFMVLIFAGLAGLQMAQAQPTSVQTNQPNLVTERWQYSITPYLWALGVTGSVSHNGSSTGTVDLTPGDLISDLKVAGMVVAEARKQRYGLYLDALYGDLGTTTSKVVDRNDLSASTTLKLSMVTFAPSYVLHGSESLTLDGLVGARYLWLNASSTITDETLGLSINPSSTQNITAAIVGLKGRWNLGKSDYFVPFYVDVGGGQSSSFTSQAYLGIGKAYDWGDISLVAKNVYYQFKPTQSNVNLNLFGAAVAVTFRF